MTPSASGAAGVSKPDVGLPSPARVSAVAVENYRTRTLRLDRSLAAEPGQFLMLWLPGLDEKPYSPQAADPIAVTVTAVGPFSRALHRLAVGDTLWLRGPFGRGFSPQGSDHLLVAGGYGVAPLAFLARRLRVAGHRVRVLIGGRSAEDILLLGTFAALGTETSVTTEDGSLGMAGTVTDALEPLLCTDPPDCLYACGPHGMLVALEELARGAALPAQLSWEAYMRCGLGLCGSCVHRGVVLCSEGPVLPVGARPPDAPPA
jgi:dihydroorotate dehydrogenase electron transfer subunit